MPYDHSRDQRRRPAADAYSSSLWGAFLPAAYGTRHLGPVRAIATTVMVVSIAIGPGVTGRLIDAGIAFPAQGLAMGLWCLGLSAAAVAISARLAPAMDVQG